MEYLNLHNINAPYEKDIKNALLQVVDSGWYLFGKQVLLFEQEWAGYCGYPAEGSAQSPFCVACANGLDALRLTLRAWIELGLLAHGDEVIVPANTYIASILAVSDSGLVPVPVEPDEQTYLIAPANIENAITSRTRAILPVHLYGQLCDMERIMQIARQHQLLVLEDCAQCHGVSKRYLGDAQAWSFYPGKNLGALGDAGAVTSKNKDLVETVRRIAFYGSSAKYVHQYKGVNSRMDEMQAAVLHVKLKDLDRCNQRRIEIASLYQKVHNQKIQMPSAKFPHVYHIFPVLADDRHHLQTYLENLGIRTQIHYPIPPHLQVAYSEWKERSFPLTEMIAQKELSLPCHQAMTDEEVHRVIDVLQKY
ncbi:MAG: aminotransferase class I/II-fold pyridoxal phosphate-dependent enzyme [Bacteroidales bacterium]|nr:aminotransferase class I/II-fold pyridoxal phosphate-dependent enzyme [Bacteroidales bacterium]